MNPTIIITAIIALTLLIGLWLLKPRNSLRNLLDEHRQKQDQHLLENFKYIQDTIHKGMQESRQQLREYLEMNTKQLVNRFDALTLTTENKLKEISGQVEKRLNEGFEKTTATFTDVIKRLALIDEAQKNITALSSEVISLQDILNDKRSRGAFGEVQLSALIRNMIPESHFELQATLSNGKRPDCLLKLPEPTGNMAIDSKFPLEDFQRMLSTEEPQEKKTAEQQFKIAIRKHIQDIASKYIIPGETADGAMMFIPAEAVFAEIHSYHPDLVTEAHRSKVWMVSPTTMMAVLTTARAVLKDDATKKQVHIIREHLNALAKDFERFEQRMSNLAKHIKQANTDAEQVHTSAQKITSRFMQIEKVELQGHNPITNPSISKILSEKEGILSTEE